MAGKWKEALVKAINAVLACLVDICFVLMDGKTAVDQSRVDWDNQSHGDMEGKVEYVSREVK